MLLQTTALYLSHWGANLLNNVSLIENSHWLFDVSLSSLDIKYLPIHFTSKAINGDSLSSISFWIILGEIS